MEMQVGAESVVRSEKRAEAREEGKEHKAASWCRPSRAGWWRKGLAPRREEGRALREATRERQTQSR